MTVPYPAGRFELRRKLAEGGQGSVWEAWDTHLERKVAVKRMHSTPDAAGVLPPSAVRALKEARAISRLTHPNIVDVYELVESETDPWIVMEYVEGDSLEHVICSAGSGPLPEATVAEIGLAVLDALKSAHAVGVVHRDVKPANILIRKAPDGPLRSRVCLVDFGNAAVAGHKTSRSVLVGTMGYIAPERFDRRNGPAVDLWSLGVTLYVAVEGRLPFQGETHQEVMAAVIGHQPDPMRRANLLRPAIAKLLTKDADDRAVAAAEVAQLLSRAAAHRRPPRDSGPGPEGDGDSGEPTPIMPGSPATISAIMRSDPTAAVNLLRQQGPRGAASILDRLEPEAVSAAVIRMADNFAAEVLGHTKAETAATALLGLEAGRGARLLTLIRPRESAALVLSALPGKSPERTTRLLRAVPDQALGHLLDGLESERFIALVESMAGSTREWTAKALSWMNFRQAATILDRFPADPAQAATLIAEMKPDAHVGRVFDHMNAERVAAILMLVPARAQRLLLHMGPEEARRVIYQMDNRPRD